MKRLLVLAFLAVLSFTATSFAQQTRMPESRIINTQSSETVHLVKRTSRVFSTTALSVSLEPRSEDVSGGLSDYPFNGTITNTTSSPVSISFLRTTQMPEGWQSAVCFGTTCFANSVDQQAQDFTANQSQALIVHVYPCAEEVPDSGTIYLKIVAASGNPADTVLLVLHLSYKPGNPPLIFKFADGTKFNVFGNGGGTHLFKPIFQNLSGMGVLYHFSMRTARMPAGWKTTVCVTDSCPGDSEVYHQLGGYNNGDGSDRATVRFTLNSPPLTAKDSAIVYLSVYPQTQNKLDSAIYRFVITLNDFATSGGPTFSATGEGEHIDTMKFSSYGSVTQMYHYSIIPERLPTGWTTSLCVTNPVVGDSCSSNGEVRYPIGPQGDPKDHAFVRLFVNSLAGSQLDSSVIWLHVYQEANPSDSANYRLVTFVQATQGVIAESPDMRAGLAVTNAWPNPLLASSRLNFEIVTDRVGNAVAHVYDMAGVEKAFLDLGGLSLGINRVQLPSLSVPSGDYIIRIVQGDAASEPVRLNYLK